MSSRPFFKHSHTYSFPRIFWLIVSISNHLFDDRIVHWTFWNNESLVPWNVPLWFQCDSHCDNKGTKWCDEKNPNLYRPQLVSYVVGSGEKCDWKLFQLPLKVRHVFNPSPSLTLLYLLFATLLFIVIIVMSLFAKKNKLIFGRRSIWWAIPVFRWLPIPLNTAM